MEQVIALYDAISDIGDVAQLVRDRVKEDLHLEFKTKKDRSGHELEESDARQFSRALSGFANSDGGVLFWGIETDKEDRAYKLKPISSVVEFEARLKKSLLNSVQPFVDNVKIESILQGGDSGQGYVKVLIPRSEKTPHRAMLADREYFRRSTEGFYRLEHFDLEDAFGRRPHPVLKMDVRLIPRPGDDPHEQISFRLRNEGRRMARYINCVCIFSDDVVIDSTDGFHNNTGLNRGKPIAVHSNNREVIHPSPIWSAIGSIAIKRLAKGTPLSVTIHWTCDGMAEEVYTGVINPDSKTQ